MIQTLWIVLAAVALAVRYLTGRTTTGGPVAHLAQGSYVGIYDSATDQNRFYGIPYAKPPVGPLRHRKPVLFAGSTPTAATATSQPPLCVQSQNSKGNNGQEDCLYLNVFAPAAAGQSQLLPVMFWIHGGGYINGGANVAGTNVVARSNNSIVFVDVQYRLGALGFLASATLDADGDPNVGLHDQRLALRWVQTNIAAFGGDPDAVMIYGESAGGNGVLSQLLAEGGQYGGLFRAAVIQSAALKANTGACESDRNNALFVKYASLLGCDATIPGVMTCVRAANQTAVTAASNAISTSAVPGQFGWTPCIDGYFYSTRPSVQLVAGAVADVPVIFGSNTDEGAGWVPSQINTEASMVQFFRDTFPNLTDAAVEGILTTYPAGDYSSQWVRAETAWGEMAYICSVHFEATACSNSTRKSSVWKYRFDQPLTDGGYVTHGLDVAYTFGIGTVTDIRNLMMDTFSGLASLQYPAWKTYDSTEMQLRLRDGLIGLEKEDQNIVQRCGFWASIYNLTGQ
ncbi:hypothetical protein HK405_005492 [Cladochytrium tenue]|nr:hypothetical protein HK405_005492 [Cladochytrium tenue]